MKQDFFIAGGTLRADAGCYIERQADRDLLRFLAEGQFCYVLTARQMGKSSLMVHTRSRLHGRSVNAVALDLTAIGQIVTPEQWYNGLLTQLGYHLKLEDELEAFCLERNRLSPVQRAFAAIREVILPRRPGPLVIFIDEIDAVRSLSFCSDEFFAAIRECFNRRPVDKEYERVTFCLLGVATPAELIRDVRAAPFNLGRRIDLTDFNEEEAAPLVERLSPDRNCGAALLRQILFWTNGHPYLTQKLCRQVVETAARVPAPPAEQFIGELCNELFLSAQAREQDDNLLFVRDRILNCEADLTKLLSLYEEIRAGQSVIDDDANEIIKHLLLAGLVKSVRSELRVRNRIYEQMFDQAWIKKHLPRAHLEKPNGEQIPIQSTCTIGRAVGNDLILADPKVSRRHVLIQVQRHYQFWLVDLGSSNGTYVNGRRLNHPVRLNEGDQLELGPFRFVFHQCQPPHAPFEPNTTTTRPPSRLHSQ